MSDLQPINLVDFTAGLNLRRSDFNLAENESPAMLNVEIDPRRGFSSRRGWVRWNAADITDVNASVVSYWNLTTAGNPATSGVAAFTAGVLHINDSDSSAVDQSTPLSGLGPADILYVGTTWSFTIATATDNTTHWSFTGTATGTLPADGEVKITDAPVSAWEPRNGYVHSLSDDTYIVYMANDGTILAAPPSGVFADLSITVVADPHLADFASWGDVVYIACGVGETCYKRDGTAAAASVADVYGNFNDDYTTPAGGYMPTAEHIEAHSGYIFVGHTEENSVDYPNRIRWSHPNQPEDWATLDFLDIETGGGRITALKSFQDHLLIFKTESVWALYGYDFDSWQLIQVSRSAGAPSPTAVTASESAIFFFSSVSRNGIFMYQGGQQVVHISEKLRTAMEEVDEPNNVWMAWVGRRLWCSIPWLPDDARVGDESSAFVFDPEVGGGAWVRHESALGSITVILPRSDTEAEYPLAAICGHSGAACLVRLDFQDRAEDKILEGGSSSAFDASYRTGWFVAEYPERLKSWRRPRFILRNPDFDVTIKVEAFADYSGDIPTRTSALTLLADASAAYWDDGWEWDDGTLWATEATGSRIERTSPFGHSRALQLRFSVLPATLGAAWGIDAIILKYIYRKLTT